MKRTVKESSLHMLGKQLNIRPLFGTFLAPFPFTLSLIGTGHGPTRVPRDAFQPWDRDQVGFECEWEGYCHPRNKIKNLLSMDLSKS